MYIEDLLKLFEETVEDNYPELINSEFISSLSMAISAKKYDVQDQALIETILKEDRETFSEEFSETFTSRIEKESDKNSFINSEEGRKEIIDLFIKSIEYMVDFYYNNIISKQFSST